jgi:hypothetical protein
MSDTRAYACSCGWVGTIGGPKAECYGPDPECPECDEELGDEIDLNAEATRPIAAGLAEVFAARTAIDAAEKAIRAALAAAVEKTRGGGS